MNKTILKTALITAGALAVAATIVFLIWFLAFPASMSSVSGQMGNYNFAIKCADMQYNRSDKTEDLAVCAEMSIVTGEDKLIIKYCEPLIAKDDFDKLCIHKNEEVAKKLSETQYGMYATDYRSYVIGNLAVSQYRTGDLQKAVQTCEIGDKECFKRLIIEVVLRGSDEDKENIRKYPQLPEAREYVEEMLNLLAKS